MRPAILYSLIFNNKTHEKTKNILSILSNIPSLSLKVLENISQTGVNRAFVTEYFQLRANTQLLLASDYFWQQNGVCGVDAK